MASSIVPAHQRITSRLRFIKDRLLIVKLVEESATRSIRSERVVLIRSQVHYPESKAVMEQTGKVLVAFGAVVAIVGALMWLGVFRWLRLGRLPGDIVVQKPGFSFFFPITTMVLISVVLMLISWLVGYFRR
jgi:hypothetical protein